MRVMKKTLFTLLPLVHFLHRNSTHDNANPKKRPPPWQSRTQGLAAWLWYQQPPAPGYLIAMGCLTRHTKDFIQRLKRATKIIHLIKASILYYSLNPPNSTAPRTIKYRPPCIPRRSHFLSYPFPFASASDMVGCCVLRSIGGCLNHDEFQLILFLPPIHRWPKSCNSFPPHRRRPARRLP